VSSDKDVHLDEDQLLWAVVDEAELPRLLQEHLSTCPRCRAAKESFEQDLAQLGQMAQRFAPLPRKRVSLPVESPRSSIVWSWDWRAYFGVAVTVALVIVIVWWSAPFRTTPGNSGHILVQEMEEAEQLMTDISMLVENALPPVYLDICGRSDPGFDEEFMQFIVPSTESEPVSYDSGKGGVVLC
jgi:predicted anti-sigma-YlaC factor YlaD